jgi:hypothetical protein
MPAMEMATWSMWWKQRGGRGVRRLLMEYWDPIGVSNTPEAADEYDAYLGSVAQMLRERAPRSQIEAYLQQTSTDHMGLEDTNESAARRRTTVSRLLEWYESEDPASESPRSTPATP